MATTRRNWQAEVARIQGELKATTDTTHGHIAWVNGCLIAQADINVRTGEVLGAHDRELIVHDAAIRRHDGQIDQIGSATAAIGNTVTDHEDRLTVLERLREHFVLPPAGWAAVVLLTAAFWWLFNSAAHWLATPTKLQDDTIVVWPQLQGWKLVGINVAIILAAAGLAYGIVSLISSGRRTAAVQQPETQPVAPSQGQPALSVVQGGGEGGDPPTQPLPAAVSGAPAP